jgi:DnaJ family protein C protein 3
MSDNYYNILGVVPDASLEEIRVSYRRKAREFHPDRAARNGLTAEEATRKFQQLQDAFDKLKEELENRNSSPQPNSPKPSDPGF